ncbi:MAG: type IX secretion system plug protein domain-containing protein [Rhodothermales bacterium]
MKHPARWIGCVLIALLFLGSGCAVSDEVRERAPRTPEREGMALALDDSTIASVQLHAGTGENALPILQMGQGVPLRLAFDIMSSRGRPLSITFYHADRIWKRDLIPAEYMARFERDDILDYRPSRSTFVDYVHYEYTFPNGTIDFRLSGNYILRVHEQGREDQVLFERPFFVSEQSVPVDMRVDNVLVAGRQYSSIQPFVRFRPSDPTASVFDFSVCFLRDALYDQMRCAQRPSLEVSPDLLFYLEPREAFSPLPVPFYVNIADVRPTGRIERTDQQSVPWRVWLEPDQAELGGSMVDPFLNGQAKIRSAVGARGEADFEAEYVSVQIRLVPPGNQPVAGAVGVLGTFSGWQFREENELVWNAQEGWYEGDVLMKQGQHTYRFVSSNQGLQQSLETGMPQLQNLLTTMVYYNDIRTQTDRLVAVQGMITR